MVGRVSAHDDDRALVQRGDITLWISTDAIDAWKPAVGAQNASAASRRRQNTVGTERYAAVFHT